jgi:formylglycine-generating enzyme required for sulfatase activity
MELSQHHFSVPNIPSFLPEPFEWIYIPGGETTTYHKVESVEAFYISKYPITNAQYMVYVQETGQEPKTSLWQDEPFKHQKGSGRETRFNLPLQPVIDLRWYEAMWFCGWLTSKMDYLITLPTEGEWMRAAQGDDNRKQVSLGQ